MTPQRSSIYELKPLTGETPNALWTAIRQVWSSAFRRLRLNLTDFRLPRFRSSAFRRLSLNLTDCHPPGVRSSAFRRFSLNLTDCHPPEVRSSAFRRLKHNLCVQLRTAGEAGVPMDFTFPLVHAGPVKNS